MKNLLEFKTQIGELLGLLNGTVEQYSKLAEKSATNFMMGISGLMILATIFCRGFEWITLSQTEFIFILTIGTIIILAAAFMKTYQFTLKLRQTIVNAEIINSRLNKIVDADLDTTKKLQELMEKSDNMHL